MNILKNENLVIEKNYLFKQRRDYTNSNNFKYVWISEGRIFLRKDDTSKVIPVDYEFSLITHILF